MTLPVEMGAEIAVKRQKDIDLTCRNGSGHRSEKTEGH